MTNEPSLPYDELKRRLADAEATLQALRSGQVATIAGEHGTLVVRSAETQAREEHIKQVLLAIRNVNQLIVSEDDPLQLIQRACVNLTENMGYFNAWIALLDEASGAASATACSGFDGGFASLGKRLESGVYTDCMRRALECKGIVVVKDPPSECMDCPLSCEYGGRSGLSRSLRHGGRTYGILAVSVPAAYAFNDEEQVLFSELAGDLAFALHRIETSKRQREHQAMLSRTERIANIGSWEWDIANDRVHWSEGLFRIFQRDPACGAPSFAEQANLYIAEDMQRLRQAVERCVTDGTPYELKLRALRTDGAIRQCVARGEAECDSQGTIRRLVGSLQDITDRWQLEERMALLARMLDEAPASITVHDTDGRFLFANHQTLRLHGYENAEEFLAINLHDLDVPESEALLAERFRLISETGEARFESAHYRRDGSILPLEVTAKITNWNGRPAIFSIAADITGRKRAEEALRDSEERNRLLSDMTMEGILLHKNAVAVDLNLAMAKMLGFAREELLNKNFMEFVHDDDRSLALENISKEYAPPYTVRLVRNTGELFFAEIESRNFQQQGDLLRVSAIRDITERKRAEDALKNSEYLLNKIFDVLPVGLWFADKNGRLLRGNPAGVRIWGAEPTVPMEEYGVFKARRLPSGKEIAPDDWALAHTIREGVTIVDELLEIDALDGQKKIILNYTAPVLDDQGNIQGAIVVNHDISERERLQAQLLQSQKMESVGRLAGGVAHDFNNMLGVIFGHTETAMEQVDPALPLYANLQEIRKAAERSSDLTRQLLAFARKQTVSPKVLDLNDTVEGMLKMLRRLIGEDIHLSWLPGANTWPVKIDPSQIDQILANLCVNARDAIAGVGKVTIETQNAAFDETYCADHVGLVSGEYVLLALSDDGCGMDKETLSHLFEPFFTTKGAGKGTGLGLATVYGIVKQNNGFLNVYSEPGQGTTLKVYLPRYQGKAEQTRMEGPQEPVMRGHETVLVVEDEEALLDLNKRILEKQGYRVLAASTPSEAIRLAEDYPGEIHLLMTDVVMPEMNGRDLSDKILSRYPHMRCLFTSGYTADVIAHHGVLDEGVHFIQKPFSRKDLAAKVRKALDRE